MTAQDAAQPRWRKASYTGQNGNCVELRGDLAAVRDSKRAGPTLLADLSALAAAAKAGTLEG